MKTEEALNISANLLGSILAAESKRPTSIDFADIARQLFDLADAIQTEEKKRTPPAQVGRLKI
jgi:hypothetical protein